jgi:hypothetical protein
VVFSLNKEQFHKIMSALTNANAALLNLTAVIVQAIPDIQPPVAGSGATEPQVQALADGINAQATILQTAVSKVTPPVLPAAPTGLTATPGAGSVALVWTGATGDTGYNVKSSAVAGGPYMLVNPTPLTTPSFTVTGKTGVPLFFVVSALNAAGESANSAEVTATPA